MLVHPLIPCSDCIDFIHSNCESTDEIVDVSLNHHKETYQYLSSSQRW